MTWDTTSLTHIHPWALVAVKEVGWGMGARQSVCVSEWVCAFGNGDVRSGLWWGEVGLWGTLRKLQSAKKQTTDAGWRKPTSLDLESYISQMKTQVRNVMVCSELQALLDDLLWFLSFPHLNALIMVSSVCCSHTYWNSSFNLGLKIILHSWLK